MLPSLEELSAGGLMGLAAATPIALMMEILTLFNW
jgi:hypothetical protein